MDAARAVFLPVCAQAGELPGAGVAQGPGQCVWGAHVGVGEDPPAETLQCFPLRNMRFVIAGLV